MNERILELKHQAFLWCDENIPEQYSYATGYGDAWEEKFAELIVRECVQVIKDCEKYGCNKPLEFEVIEHFGVEE